MAVMARMGSLRPQADLASDLEEGQARLLVVGRGAGVGLQDQGLLEVAPADRHTARQLCSH